MQHYTFPRYLSTTEWTKHGFTPPHDKKTFSALDMSSLCPCVFRTGLLFHWKECRGKMLPDKVLIASNDLVLENAMWMMHALLQLVELIQANRGEAVCGKLIQDSILILESINGLDWPCREENLALLVLNRDKPWSKLAPGQIKLPWLLLPSCNESLRLWLESELLLTRQRWHIAHPPISAAQYIDYYVTAARLLNRAVECASICPSDYKAALVIEWKLRTVDAFFWLGQKAIDEAHKLKLYEAARTLGLELGKDIPVAKFDRIDSDTVKAQRAFNNLAGILNYSTTPSAESQMALVIANDDLILSKLMEFKFF